MKSIERRIESIEQDGIPKTLERITTVLDLQSERNKERDSLNQRQNETLENINQNLTNLNHKIDATSDEIMRTNERVDSLENKVINSEEKNKIDWRDLIIKAFYVIVPAGIMYLITTSTLK